MKKRTKALQFDQKTKEKIMERDRCCVFCKIHYAMPPKPIYELCVLDIMHIINRSQGGLGIKENGVLGCRYHHHLLDNGNRGLRKEMLQLIEEYMKGIYPDWSKDHLRYQKYSG